MPAVNPRLTITLDPALAATLRRLSELTGSSQSKLISEILEGSQEVFAKVIRVLEAAEAAKAEVKGRAAANLDAAQSRMESQLQLVMGEFDEYTGSLLSEVESIKRRARRHAPGRAQPDTVRGAGSGTKAVPSGGGKSAARGASTPLSNRGVRSDPKKAGKPVTMRVSGELKPKSYKRARAAKKGVL